MDVMDIDVYEHNEAFASASCAVAQEVGIPEDRFNLHGGAVALGHPLGSSGTRCLITMIGVMRRIEPNRELFLFVSAVETLSQCVYHLED